MTKLKRKILLVILLLLTAFLSITLFASKITNAQTEQENNSVTNIENEDISTYGLYTDLRFSLDGGNGKVWASVKNKFTLFPATVTVYIYLFSSDTYCENYQDMTLVAQNYIYDLDQGNTVTATASTNLQQKYWKYRAYYQIDNKGWQENISDTLLFDEYGVLI